MAHTQNNQLVFLHIWPLVSKRDQIKENTGPLLCMFSTLTPIDYILVVNQNDC